MQRTTIFFELRRPGLPATAALLAALAGTHTVHAQDALGDGRVLDSNLRVGSGGRNDAGRDFRSELAFRNAIVTGNVGGGREFRGSVGYTATDDFRGFLGSNASFQFERDSFYSGLATRNLSGIESIRNPLAYTVAGQRDGVFGGGLIVNRAGVGASASQLDPAQAANPQATDVFGNIAGTLRSPSFQITQNQRMPDVIALGGEPDANGDFDVMSASPLIGIKSMRSTSPVFNPIESAAELSRRTLPGTGLPTIPTDPLEPATERVPSFPSPHQAILDALRATPGAERISPPPRAIPDSPAPFPSIPPTTTDPSTRAPDPATAADPAQTYPFDQNLENLRTMLRTGRPAPPPTPAEDATTIDEPADADASDPDDKEQPRTAPELAAHILAGKSVHVMDLAHYPSESEIFREHMRRGQELLAARRWFDAEERFTAALATKPGDPIAAAARVNAQIAAGMYRSAAVNMRNLLIAYPEMTVARFDQSLLGNPQDLDRVKADLRERTEFSSATARDCAILMAYTGFQTADTEAVNDAFALLDRIATDMEMPTSELERTLRAVWTNPAPTSAPTPAP